jgi:hypothetical protein
MSEIPLIMLGGALLLIFGLFFVLKSFKMPASFSANQQKREEIKKRLSNRQSENDDQPIESNPKEANSEKKQPIVEK